MWNVLANAAGTLIAAAVIYLVGVLAGVITADPGLIVAAIVYVVVIAAFAKPLIRTNVASYRAGRAYEERRVKRQEQRQREKQKRDDADHDP